MSNSEFPTDANIDRRNEKCTFSYIAWPNKANNRQRNVTSVTLSSGKRTFPDSGADTKKKRNPSGFLNISRDDATRTHDPYVPNVVR